nr:methyltransferase domain-containing protein [Pseudonocardia acidicola]
MRGRLELLPAGGRALELACGRGAVAVWLAQRGFAVDAVDVSGAGLEAAAALATRSGAGDRVRLVAADLDDGIPASCPGPYDVVVCQRFRDPRLYDAMAARLAPGGLLVVTVLSAAGDEPGPFRAAPGELAAAFGAIAGLQIVSHDEGNGAASLIARRR